MVTNRLEAPRLLPKYIMHTLQEKTPMSYFGGKVSDNSVHSQSDKGLRFPFTESAIGGYCLINCQTEKVLITLAALADQVYAICIRHKGFLLIMHYML